MGSVGKRPHIAHVVELPREGFANTHRLGVGSELRVELNVYIDFSHIVSHTFHEKHIWTSLVRNTRNSVIVGAKIMDFVSRIAHARFSAAKFPHPKFCSIIPRMGGQSMDFAENVTHNVLHIRS